MKYTTTTISSRMVMVKVKTKPPLGNRLPPPNQSDNSAGRSVSPAVPLLFNRSSTTRVMAAEPTLWWENWKSNTLIFFFTLLLLGGIYFLLTQDRSPVEKRSRSVEPPTVSAPSVINIRPMGMSSSRPSAFSGPGQMSGGVGGGNFGASMAGGSGGGAHSASSGIGAEHAALDGRSKLVLPADVSGACNVGESGLQDLAGCLSRNGARVE